MAVVPNNPINIVMTPIAIRIIVSAFGPWFVSHWWNGLTQGMSEYVIFDMILHVQFPAVYRLRSHVNVP
jgi:hypothetical protein